MEIRTKPAYQEIRYKLTFTKEGDEGWYSFPCNSQGILDESAITEGALRNYARVKNDTKTYKSFLEKRAIWIPKENTGICDNCGEEFEIHNEYMGACSCPNCGAWYNLFGQSLLPPDEWELTDEYL